MYTAVLLLLRRLAEDHRVRWRAGAAHWAPLDPARLGSRGEHGPGAGPRGNPQFPLPGLEPPKNGCAPIGFGTNRHPRGAEGQGPARARTGQARAP